jgi:acyl transferase domain-containing protein
MKGDPAEFDNQFFSIPKGEVMSLDPQQRLMMENVYQALENGTYYYSLQHLSRIWSLT